MITASINNLRISPRKVRSVANLVRGKDVATALNTLTFVSKKGKHPLKTLLESALANAKNNHKIEKDGLMVKELRVDTGVTLKRSMPRARGSAYPINKRSSHVMLVLAPKVEKVKKQKPAKAQAEPEVKAQ
jgi:large subunit ribosomal protein L22